MASNMFMKMEGIDGESTHADYQKWCEIYDIGFSIDNDIYKDPDDEDEGDDDDDEDEGDEGDDDEDDDDDDDEEEDDGDFGISGMFERAEAEAEKFESEAKKRITSTIGEVGVSKYMDLASTSIMEKCWRNSVLTKVELVLLRPDGTDSGLEYLRIEMENVTITGYKLTYGKDDILKEEMKLVSKKVQYIYKSAPRKGQGIPVVNKLQAYDMVKGYGT